MPYSYQHKEKSQLPHDIGNEEVQSNSTQSTPMKSKAYIAVYPFNTQDNTLDEEIIATDTYWSPALIKIWDSLITKRIANITGKYSKEPMIQAWYFDDNFAQCMATTNQPFKLE